MNSRRNANKAVLVFAARYPRRLVEPQPGSIHMGTGGAIPMSGIGLALLAPGHSQYELGSRRTERHSYLGITTP